MSIVLPFLIGLFGGMIIFIFIAKGAAGKMKTCDTCPYKMQASQESCEDIKASETK